MKTVSRLSIAPVKGMALVHPEEIDLERNGVADNRRFYLVDDLGDRVARAACVPRPTREGLMLLLVVEH